MGRPVSPAPPEGQHPELGVQHSGEPDVEVTVSSSWAIEPDLRIGAGPTSPLAAPVHLTAMRAEAADVVRDAYEAFQRDIHSFLRAATRDVEVAEDLTQETFIRLVNEARAGRTPDNIRAWLYTVASHLVTSRARRNKVAERFKSILAIRGSADSPESDALRREQRSEVHHALAQLPADSRTALLLSAHGFSGQEIGRVLGRTEGATRTLLCRARIKLREQLTKDASGGGAGRSTP